MKTLEEYKQLGNDGIRELMFDVTEDMFNITKQYRHTSFKTDESNEFYHKLSTNELDRIRREAIAMSDALTGNQK